MNFFLQTEVSANCTKIPDEIRFDVSISDVFISKYYPMFTCSQGCCKFPLMGEEDSVKKVVDQFKDQKLDDFMMECVRNSRKIDLFLYF